jgi:hypothetical protein
MQSAEINGLMYGRQLLTLYTCGTILVLNPLEIRPVQSQKSHVHVLTVPSEAQRSLGYFFTDRSLRALLNFRDRTPSALTARSSSSLQ